MKPFVPEFDILHLAAKGYRVVLACRDDVEDGWCVQWPAPRERIPGIGKWHSKEVFDTKEEGWGFAYQDSLIVKK